MSERFWLGFLGVLVFAGAVFGAYKFGQKSIYPEPVEGPTPTPEAVAIPTPEPTAGWKTYIDTAYNYSIKYPSDWYHRPTPTGRDIRCLLIEAKI